MNDESDRARIASLAGMTLEQWFVVVAKRELWRWQYDLIMGLALKNKMGAECARKELADARRTEETS